MTEARAKLIPALKAQIASKKRSRWKPEPVIQSCKNCGHVKSEHHWEISLGHRIFLCPQGEV